MKLARLTMKFGTLALAGFGGQQLWTRYKGPATEAVRPADPTPAPVDGAADATTTGGDAPPTLGQAGDTNRPDHRPEIHHS